MNMFYWMYWPSFSGGCKNGNKVNLYTKALDKIKDAYWFCRNHFRDYVFYPIYYRMFGHKHHIIKTNLPPMPWYDVDIRMLYGIMELVKWFVENDMMKITKKEYKKECESIRKSTLKYPSVSFRMDSWVAQWENQNKILKIYKWWKNYPNRQKKISEALHNWHNYLSGFQSNKNDVMEFLSVKNKMNKVQKKKEERLSKILHDLENKLGKEEQEMLKMAVELRGSMWS